MEKKRSLEEELKRKKEISLLHKKREREDYFHLSLRIHKSLHFSLSLHFHFEKCAQNTLKYTVRENFQESYCWCYILWMWQKMKISFI
jgi:hypothetical protein